MDNEAEFTGLPSREIVEMQLGRFAAQLKAPAELLPSIGRMDESKRHFVEMGEIYYHYIFYNRGQEISRHTTERLDELLYWVFRDVTFEMASNEAGKDLVPGIDIREPIYRIQGKLMENLKKAWSERLRREMEEVLTRNPFKTRPSGPRKLSLRNTAAPLPPPPPATAGDDGFGI